MDGNGSAGIAKTNTYGGGGGGGRHSTGNVIGCGSANTCDNDNYVHTERLRAAMIQIMEMPDPDPTTEIGGFCRMSPDLCAAYLNDLKHGAVPWHIAVYIHCGDSAACRQDYGLAGPMSGPTIGSTLNHNVGDAIFLSFIGGGTGASATVRLIKAALSGEDSAAATSPVLKQCVLQYSFASPNSFDPATPVLMADGTTKPIRDIQVGDHVLSTDPSTGTTRSEVVTALHNNLDEDLVDVEVATSDSGTAVLHTTVNHPFWDKTDRKWVDASSLQPGHRLDTTGGVAEVLALRPVAGNSFMLNLTVRSLHTYYVLAGDVPILVHNDSPPWGQPGHSDYVLVDRATNKVYYAGRFGPNESAASVLARHTKSGRFRPGLDRIDVVPGTRTYGEARLMEDDLASMYGTRTGGGRGNAIWPMQQAKRESYYNYASTC